jgi:nucleotide-binding universal stress UspA family protein
MTTLIPVDGSTSSERALSYAALEDPEGEVLLLHVAPSARQADLERGRFLLEDSGRKYRLMAKDVHVELRLEVGNPAEKLKEAAHQCDRVVMGAHGLNAMPQLHSAGSETCPEPDALGCPVTLVLPTGEPVAAGL